MGTPREQMFAIATSNRLLAAEMFAGLSDDQWRTPSLCAGWTVREIAAHLVPPEGGFTFRGVARDVIRFRGDLDRMVDVTTRERARLPTDVLVSLLRDRAGTELSAPVVGAAGPMTDTAVHLRDAARPLGLDIAPEPSTWRPVLDFLVSRPAARGFMPGDRLRGLRLSVPDLDWSWGDGAEVRGTGEAVALGVAGRRVVLDELDGPGVGVLAGRLGA